MSKAEELAAFHRAMVEDERFGYSQWPQRWGGDGYTITIMGHEIDAGSYDCSSSVIASAHAIELPVGDANYTGDTRSEFTRCGWLCLPYDANILQVGDIILNEGRHVAVYQGGGMMSEFRHNEFGGIYNGQTGDQTGDEACIAPLRDFGQQWILRWPDEPVTIEGAVYRLYNPYADRHHYTTSVAEVNELIRLGWNYEGCAWTAPETGAPVWRLRNPWSGDHMWTASSDEHDELMGKGWVYEGIAWRSNGDTVVRRLYHPSIGDHLLTCDRAEYERCLGAGWQDEGAAFWAA